MNRRPAFTAHRCPGCGRDTDRGSVTSMPVKIVVWVGRSPKDRGEKITCSTACAETVLRRAFGVGDGARLEHEVSPPAPVAIQVPLPLALERREAAS